ncbi:phytanoyl-CoA dioxygenase family protein [Actinopolymorpha singaporensis]|uniref:2-oxoglutarate-dependent dioxygenase n=1 Tax=Actinopolymorpha singaporensis TaxID=117157 RepID=A0A1H1RPW3_9ACTN|nr:phytanoyl-CoA dioxygenase family protein [Actinopolymorpha singaporensis]SDS37632.1 2-oxoglutarate-dependent dioxygenase [Actinopolymorpha singaporensis]
MDTPTAGVRENVARAGTAGKVVRELTLTDGEVAFYHQYGYLLLPGFVEPAVVEALRTETLDVLEANGVSRASLEQASGVGDKLRQCSAYVAGSALDELINCPATLAVASRLVGGRAVRYLPFTAVKAGGGGGTFHLHQDNSYTRHDPAMGSINIWVALDDMTPDNGCLQIVPRSHLGEQLQARGSDDGDAHRQVDVDPATALPIRMRAGDAVAFSRWTVHGSGPNHTDRPRVAYALQYHREDVRWLDAQTGEWHLLLDTPRTNTEPVARLDDRPN